jgi:hypothetical protein
MTGQNSSSSSGPVHVISDPDQATLLTDAQLRVFLLPFLGRVKSVSQVAAELGIKVNAMLYRVQQMLACGLLEPDHLEARGGRPIQYYRAVADVLFVPFTATVFETLEAQIKHGDQAQHQRFVRALAASRQQQMLEDGWGTLLSRDAGGNINVIRARLNVSDPNSSDVNLNALSVPDDGLPMSVWSQIPLRPETARELAGRLQALLNEYLYQLAPEGEATHLLHVGFTRE